MSFTSRKSVRVLSILLVLTVAFSLLLLLPPVQGLFISAGERLKGRELNGGHWRTALSSLSLCVILFSAIAGALFSAAVKFSGIAGLAAAVNGSRVKGRYIAVAFFLLTLLAAGAYITAGHDWGDDFSEYIQQGICIAEGTYGTEYAGNALFTGYPHGFPLLIAAVYRLFGFNLLAFKMINVVFYAAFVAVFFLYCDARLKRLTAITASFLFAFSPCLYKLLDCILSDTVSMVLAFFGLAFISLFFEEEQGSRRLLYSVAAGFFSGLAYVFRDSGIILPCTLAFVQLVRLVRLLKSGKLKAGLASVAVNLLPYVVFLLLGCTFNRLLFPLAGRNDMGILNEMNLTGLLVNSWYYFDRLSFFFYPKFIWFAVFTAVAWAMLRTFWQSMPFVIYFLGIMAMYIIWPGGGQGIRYVVSVLPVIVFLGGRAVELLCGPGGGSGGSPQSPRPLFVFNWQSYALLAALLCASSLSVCLVADVRNLVSGRKTDINSFSKDAVEMYQYMDDTVADEKRIYFFKPRLLHMTTGNAAVYCPPGHPVDVEFDYYLHTFDHGYGQLLADEQARAGSFSFGGHEFTCVHENATMKLFQRTGK